MLISFMSLVKVQNLVIKSTAKQREVKFKVMPTHSDWHDFTVSVLKCKEVRKIYRDPSYCPKILKLFRIVLPLRYYISFTLHNIKTG